MDVATLSRVSSQSLKGVRAASHLDNWWMLLHWGENIVSYWKGLGLVLRNTFIFTHSKGLVIQSFTTTFIHFFLLVRVWDGEGEYSTEDSPWGAGEEPGDVVTTQHWPSSYQEPYEGRPWFLTLALWYQSWLQIPRSMSSSWKLKSLSLSWPKTLRSSSWSHTLTSWSQSGTLCSRSWFRPLSFGFSLGLKP